MRYFILLSVLIFPVGSLLASAPPELAAEVQRGLCLVNNGQLLEAYSLFHQYNEQYPQEKEDLFFLALTKWKMMWLSTYNENDRQELMNLLGQVEDICVPTMEEDNDARFYFAAVQGVRAQVAATENDWWETAQLGKKMKNNAEKITKSDPNYFSAYYLLGCYNYFADALPGYIKFLRSLMFIPGGDRIGGLKQLIRSYEKGGIVSAEAGRTLAIIYTYYESRPDYGVQMCENLLTFYPQNFEVGLYKGINLYFSMSWEQAEEWLQHLRKEIIAYSAKQGSIKDHSNGEVVAYYVPLERETRYWLSRTLIQQHRYAEARSMLMELADPPIHQPYWLIRWVYLSLAQIEYQSGNPGIADGWVNKVLAWKDVKDSTDKAKLLRNRKDQIGYFDIDFR